MIRKTFRLMLCILFLIAILAACAAPIPQPTTTPTQPALVVEPGSISGRVDIGGRSLFITCKGEGSPTVIFESGTGADHYYWKSVLAEVSKHTLACAYDRGGLVRSDPAKTLPRTTQDMVDDLHALLTNASIQGPYILVGHSMGAYIIRLFTSQYSQEVVGLVFIDSYTPDLYESYCAALPTESADEDTSYKGARAECQAILAPVSDWSLVDEGFDSVTSTNQVRSTGPYGDLPLVSLAAEYSITGTPGTAEGMKGEMWEQAQRNLANLSTRGQFSIVKNADHISILEKQAVWDAIIEMVNTLQD